MSDHQERQDHPHEGPQALDGTRRRDSRLATGRQGGWTVVDSDVASP